MCRPDPNLYVFEINSDNVGQILPKLQVDSVITDDVKSLVNAGKIVTISKNNINLGRWQGVGYIAVDPVTGSGGYFVSGGLSGGGFDEEIELDDSGVNFGEVLDTFFSLFSSTAEAAQAGSNTYEQGKIEIENSDFIFTGLLLIAGGVALIIAGFALLGAILVLAGTLLLVLGLDVLMEPARSN